MTTKFTSGEDSFLSEVLLDLDKTEDLLLLLGVALSIRIVGTWQFATSCSGCADSTYIRWQDAWKSYKEWWLANNDVACYTSPGTASFLTDTVEPDFDLSEVLLGLDLMEHLLELFGVIVEASLLGAASPFSDCDAAFKISNGIAVIVIHAATS